MIPHAVTIFTNMNILVQFVKMHRHVLILLKNKVESDSAVQSSIEKTKSCFFFAFFVKLIFMSASEDNCFTFLALFL